MNGTCVTLGDRLDSCFKQMCSTLSGFLSNFFFPVKLNGCNSGLMEDLFYAEIITFMLKKLILKNVWHVEAVTAMPKFNNSFFKQQRENGIISCPDF